MTLVISVWRWEDNLEKLALSIYHVSPGIRTQVIGLGGKYFYLLAEQPTSPATSQFLIKTMGQEAASPLFTQYTLFPSMVIIYIDQAKRFDIPFKAS